MTQHGPFSSPASRMISDIDHVEMRCLAYPTYEVKIGPHIPLNTNMKVT